MNATRIQLPEKKKKNQVNNRTTLNFGLKAKALAQFKDKCEGVDRKHTDVLRFFIDSVNDGTFIMDDGGLCK